MLVGLEYDTPSGCTGISWAFEVTAAPVALSSLLWLPFFLTVTRNDVLGRDALLSLC